MTITVDMIDRVRRMINEPTDDIYSNATISGYLTESDEDINAVASVIWSEKVAALQATTYDISADGADYRYSQKIDNAKELARYFSSKRTPTSSLWIKDPEETNTSEDLQ